MNPSRRDVFRMMLAAGFWTAGGSAFAKGIDDPDQSATTARLVRLFSDPESARAVGNAYLRACPEDADRIFLEASFDSSAVRSCGTEPSALREAIVSEIRRDFDTGQAVTVEGWIVSRTEARLCALVALSCP